MIRLHLRRSALKWNNKARDDWTFINIILGRPPRVKGEWQYSFWRVPHSRILRHSPSCTSLIWFFYLLAILTTIKIFDKKYWTIFPLILIPGGSATSARTGTPKCRYPNPGIGATSSRWCTINRGGGRSRLRVAITRSPSTTTTTLVATRRPVGGGISWTRRVHYNFVSHDDPGSFFILKTRLRAGVFY